MQSAETLCGRMKRTVTEMYDELIKALRNCGDTEIDGCDNCKYQEPQMTCNQHLMMQAADAIEELSRIVREYQKFDGFLAAHGMFKQDPMVPLPEPPKEET